MKSVKGAALATDGDMLWESNPAGETAPMNETRWSEKGCGKLQPLRSETSPCTLFTHAAARMHRRRLPSFQKLDGECKQGRLSSYVLRP